MSDLLSPLVGRETAPYGSFNCLLSCKIAGDCLMHIFTHIFLRCIYWWQVANGCNRDDRIWPGSCSSLGIESRRDTSTVDHVTEVSIGTWPTHMPVNCGNWLPQSHQVVAETAFETVLPIFYHCSKRCESGRPVVSSFSSQAVAVHLPSAASQELIAKLRNFGTVQCHATTRDASAADHITAESSVAHQEQIQYLELDFPIHPTKSLSEPWSITTWK